MADAVQTATKFFLDRASVLEKVEKGKRRALSKFGAFVRRSARSSIRKSKKSAAPGTPPKSHRGDLKRLIFFSLDPEKGSVVVGPVVFPKARPQSPGAPEALEYAGTVTRTVKTPLGPSGRKAAGRQGKAYSEKIRKGLLPKPPPPPSKVEQKTFKYRGNPFMHPAFRDNLTNPKLRDCIQDCIH